MNQKLISEFINLGCQTKKEAAIALQVYLELCEVKKYFDVEYHFSEDLKCIYIHGKKTKSSKITTFVPIAVSACKSFSELEAYFSLSVSEPKSVVLAMVESDSTCVYYEITDGIKEPPPETPPLDIEEKRARLDMELLKNSKFLEESALYGIPITLNKGSSKKSNIPETD